MHGQRQLGGQWKLQYSEDRLENNHVEVKM